MVPVLVADQCLKVWVKLNFSLGERMAFIPGLLELQFIENEGMAFGWALPGMAGKLVLTGFRLVAAVGMVFTSRNSLRRERTRVSDVLGVHLGRGHRKHH